MAKLTDEKIDARAQELLDWITSLEPTWGESIRIARSENHWTARQCLGAFVGYVLENELYMAVPLHPAFEPGFQPPDSPGVCDTCHEAFTPTYPGQHYCGNDCARGVTRQPAAFTEADPAALTD